MSERSYVVLTPFLTDELAEANLTEKDYYIIDCRDILTCVSSFSIQKLWDYKEKVILCNVNENTRSALTALRLINDFQIVDDLKQALAIVKN